MLRKAGPDADFAAILKLVQDSFAYMETRIDPPSSMHRLTVESVRQHAAEEEIWYDADEKGPFACVFFTRKPGRLYLGKMAVRDDYRRRGLAKAMVDKAAERALALGLPTLELQARIELVENHRTFAGFGFVKTGEDAHEGYDRPTSITMQRPAKWPA